MRPARVALGATGLMVSRLGFGCSTIASLNTRHAPGEVRATLRAALEAGINFFDTADVYGQGDSERMLGQLRSGAGGGDMVIATKVGLDIAYSQHAVRWVKPLLQPLMRRWAGARRRSVGLRRAAQRHCADAAQLARRVDASLARLRCERLDLLLLHSPPVQWAARDDMRRLLQDLLRSGKAHACGISVESLQDIPAWLEWDEVSCLQVPLAPLQGGAGPARLAPAAGALLRQAQSRGVAVIAREIFGSGALAADADARRRAMSAVLGAPGVAVGLVGMGCRAHLADNLAAYAQLRVTEPAS